MHATAAHHRRSQRLDFDGSPTHHAENQIPALVLGKTRRVTPVSFQKGGSYSISQDRWNVPATQDWALVEEEEYIRWTTPSGNFAPQVSALSYSYLII